MILGLDFNILLYIFSFINDIKDYKNVLLSCKYLKNVMEKTFHNLYINNKEMKIIIVLFDFYLNNYIFFLIKNNVYKKYTNNNLLFKLLKHINNIEIVDNNYNLSIHSSILNSFVNKNLFINNLDLNSLKHNINVLYIKGKLKNTTNKYIKTIVINTSKLYLHEIIDNLKSIYNNTNNIILNITSFLDKNNINESDLNEFEGILRLISNKISLITLNNIFVILKLNKLSFHSLKIYFNEFSVLENNYSSKELNLFNCFSFYNYYNYNINKIITLKKTSILRTDINFLFKSDNIKTYLIYPSVDLKIVIKNLINNPSIQTIIFYNDYFKYKRDIKLDSVNFVYKEIKNKNDYFYNYPRLKYIDF